MIARQILDPSVAQLGLLRPFLPLFHPADLSPSLLTLSQFRGEPAYAKVLAHFGPSILLPNSSAIDRSALGQRIFSSPADRAVLNSITHPAVRRAMARAVLRCWWRGEKVVVMDVPLLVETGLWKWVAKTVVVYVYVHPLESKG